MTELICHKPQKITRMLPVLHKTEGLYAIKLLPRR
jgi:hypothetical protein